MWLCHVATYHVATYQNNIALVGNKIDLEKEAGDHIVASEFTDTQVHADKCKVRTAAQNQRYVSVYLRVPAYTCVCLRVRETECPGIEYRAK